MQEPQSPSRDPARSGRPSNARRESQGFEAERAAAKRQHDENLAFDEVWCVCDVDDHPKLSEALVMAKDNGIRLALSNPAFEIWLVLHFRDSPGPQHRNQVAALLKAFLRGYQKDADFVLLAQGYEAAVERARRLDEMAEQEGHPGRNPTTGVWRLTESIRQPGQRETR